MNHGSALIWCCILFCLSNNCFLCFVAFLRSQHPNCRSSLTRARQTHKQVWFHQTWVPEVSLYFRNDTWQNNLHFLALLTLPHCLRRLRTTSKQHTNSEFNDCITFQKKCWPFLLTTLRTSRFGNIKTLFSRARTRLFSNRSNFSVPNLVTIYRKNINKYKCQ